MERQAVEYETSTLVSVLSKFFETEHQRRDRGLFTAWMDIEPTFILLWKIYTYGGKAMANYPQELAQDALCQSHTGHMSGLWFLPSPAFKAEYWWMNTNMRRVLVSAILLNFKLVDAVLCLWSLVAGLLCLDTGSNPVQSTCALLWA